MDWVSRSPSRSVIAAFASWLRGGKYVYTEPAGPEPISSGSLSRGEATAQPQTATTSVLDKATAAAIDRIRSGYGAPLPASLAPFGQSRTLGAERRIVAVTGVDVGVIG